MTILMAIGGAVNFEQPSIIQEFIRYAGGAQAHIVILPQASSLADTGVEYQDKFQDLGAERRPTVLDFRDRADTDKPEHLEALRNATGVFITGGTQMRIPALIGGSSLEFELLAAYQRGAIVGGTSAGAAVLSKVMLAYGRSGATPRERIAQFTPGLGFTDKIIFDQHFRQRDRLGRLAYAISTHPGLLGVGVDENTAAIVEDDECITVCGKNAVTIVDGKTMTATNVAEVTRSRPVAVSNLTVHVLTAGCSFNMRIRSASIPKISLE